MTQKLASFLTAALLSTLALATLALATLALLPTPALACGGAYGEIRVPTANELVATSALHFLEQVRPETAGVPREVESLAIEGSTASVRIRALDRIYLLSLALQEGRWVVRTWRTRGSATTTETAPRS